MSMTAGSVSVDENEVVTGTGLALALYTADAATMTLPSVPSLGVTSPPYRAGRPSNATDVALTRAGRVQALREVARRATAYAAGIVSYLQGNAVATISTQSTGRIPTLPVGGTPIDPPEAPVSLPIT